MMRNNAKFEMDDFAHTGSVKFVRRGHESEMLPRIRERLVGVSPWARSAPAAIVAHALHTNSILVEGEPGTGKEFVARMIHECGPRNHRPFVVLQSDSLDETVLKSILFEAPSALPAPTRTLQREYADQAKGGTLYVSDVSTLSPEFRHRLVRSIQRPEVEHSRRQSLKSKNIRLVFGSSYYIAPAASENERGAASCVLRIPALRNRTEDIDLLSEYFSVQMCYRLGKEPRVLSADAVVMLCHNDWPGNVGELKRVVELMVRRSGPPLLDASLLPADLSGQSAHIHLGDAIDEGINLHDEVQRYEKSLLNAALARCGGIQTKAAQLLGLKVSTLNSKLSAYNIDASAFKHRRSA